MRHGREVAVLHLCDLRTDTPHFGLTLGDLRVRDTVIVALDALRNDVCHQPDQDDGYDNKRVYAIGGEGAISVFEQQDPDHYKESARIATVKGARTGFFSPELDRLFLAVRRQGTQTAAIRVFVSIR